MSRDPSKAGSRLLRRLALTCALLMLLVVASSSALRLSQARMACPEWPTCRLVLGPVTTGEVQGLPAAALSTVRVVHRVAASAVLLIIIAMLLRARGLPATAGLTLSRDLWALLILALGLSALGIAVPGAREGLPMLGNLLGGLSMLALSWAVVRKLDDPVAPPLRMQRVARWTTLAWLAQAASGAWSGAAGVGAGSVAPILHLALAVVTVSLALWLGLSLRRTARRVEGQWLLVLLGLQLLLGAWALIASPKLAMLLLHNGSAAAGLALVAGVALGGPRPADHGRSGPST